MDSPHTKASLLLQSHFSCLTLHCPDYLTDTKSVMDNAPRVMQAIMDVCAESGWLASTLRVVAMLQMLVQARLDTVSSFLSLPHVQHHMLYLFSPAGITNLPLAGLTSSGLSLRSRRLTMSGLWSIDCQS